MQRSLILAIASFAAFASMAVSPASAATALRASHRVSYADLNLDNQAGAATLLNRIRDAAGVMCGDRTGFMSLREHASIRRCERTHIEKGVSDVGSPTLTTLYYDRHPSITIDE